MIDIGTRMKAFEDNRRLVSDGGPIIARLDGKNFHTWTRGLNRPYDSRLSEIMALTARYLAIETNALLAYTQSDEISLTWNPTGDTEPIYGGKVQKMASLLAAECTSAFNSMKTLHDEFTRKNPALFDCRVFQVPDIQDGADYFYWRLSDCYKNSISMAAQSMFSHKELQGKNSNAMLNMLLDKDTNYFKYPEFFKKGTSWKQEKVIRKFTTDELEDLPPKHEARINPDLEVERIEYKKYHDVVDSEWIYGE